MPIDVAFGIDKDDSNNQAYTEYVTDLQNKIKETFEVVNRNATGERMLNTFCPGRGSNQDLLRGSQTLYRIALKAGLYRKAVQVCIIPNITTLR